MKVEIAPHTLATVDLYAGNGDLLLPVYTATGKLPTLWLQPQGWPSPMQYVLHDLERTL